MAGEHPDWLPVDWRVCVRVRSYGRKDKYYINPLNGLKFNSKPDVLRYLKNAGTEPTLNELTKIDIEKAVPEEIPSGWIKEIRDKRKGDKTRRDPYYIDPVSGSHFRSLQEVFCYLETKDSGKSESKEDDQDQEPSDHSKTSAVGAKGQRLTDEKVNNIFTAGNGSIKTSDVLETKCMEQREIEADSVAGDLPDKLPQVHGKRRNEEGGLRRNTRLANSKLKNNVTDDQFLQSGSKVAAVKKISMLETDTSDKREKERVSVAEDLQQHEKVTRENKRKKLNSKWMNDLPRRTSKRLAGVEADPSLEVKTSKQAVAARLLSDEAEIITTENTAKARPSDKPETNNTSKDFGNSYEAETEVPTKNNKQKDPTNLLHGDLISSLEEHQSVGFNFKADEKQLDSSLDDLLMDPCIEFAIKTLTGAIPIEDVIKVDESSVSSSLASPHQTSGCSSVLPSGDIWADPCFEFAVKMLTDDISVGPLSSSGAGGCNNSPDITKG